jgi:tRNA(Ile)-lysidine synthase TilS/MesJ
MIQWDMIQEGDRLLLGLSGGKDSLSLLHCLLEFQRKLPIKFDIEVSDFVTDVKWICWVFLLSRHT